MMNRSRVDRIKAQPISDIARSLGCHLAPCGPGIWGICDPQNPREVTSIRLWDKKGCWRRWSGKTAGGVDRGDHISLVQHWNDCDFKEALEFLSDRLL